MIKDHTDWWFYFVLGGTSGNFSKSDEQTTSTHMVLMVKTIGAALLHVFQFYCLLASDLNHVVMLFFHCFSWKIGGQGHTPDAQSPYTSQHLLDDPKQLNIISNEMWEMLNFSPPQWVSTYDRCLRISYVSRLTRTIGATVRLAEIWKNWHTSSSLCQHRLVLNATMGLL